MLGTTAKLVKTKEHFLVTEMFLDQAAGGTALYGREETIIFFFSNT